MPAVRTFAHEAVAPSADVVIPELVSTLEWVLESPPNVHQFDEPPVSKYFLCGQIFHICICYLLILIIYFTYNYLLDLFFIQIIIEIEHLKNLTVAQDH